MSVLADRETHTGSILSPARNEIPDSGISLESPMLNDDSTLRNETTLRRGETNLASPRDLALPLPLA